MQKLRKALSVSLAVGVLATACSVFSAPAAADGGQVSAYYYNGMETKDGLSTSGSFDSAIIDTAEKNSGESSLKLTQAAYSTMMIRDIAVTPGKTYMAAVSVHVKTRGAAQWMALDIRRGDNDEQYTGTLISPDTATGSNPGWFALELSQADQKFYAYKTTFTVPSDVTDVSFGLFTDGGGAACEIWFDDIVVAEVPEENPEDILSGSRKPGFGKIVPSYMAELGVWAEWSSRESAGWSSDWVSWEVSKDGEASFVLDNTSGNLESSKLMLPLELTDDTWYKFSGYVKTQGTNAEGVAGDQGVYTLIGNMEGGNTPDASDVKVTAPVTADVDWQYFELVYHYTESDKDGYAPYIVLYNWPGRGTAWFAGLSLTETEDPAAQVENPPSLDMEKETVAETGLELTGSFAQAAFDTGVKYSGEKSLKLESTGDNSLTYPDVKVTPGSTVVFGAYLRFESIIPNPSDGAWMSMFLVDSATGETIKEYSNVGFANSIQSLNGGFAEHRIKAEIPEGVEKVDLVIRTGGGGSFEFWLDDMNLITLPEESTDKDNLLDYNIMPEYSDMLSCSSPAMANMNTVHWESWVEPQSAIITTDRLVKRDGEYSFKFDTSKGNFLGENTHARLYVTAGGLEAGETYTLSAYVKTQDLQPADGGFQLIFDTLPGNDLNGFEPGRLAATDLISGDNDWTYVETTFVYSPQEGAVPTVCLSSFNTKGVAWVDGIRLVKGEGSGEGSGEDVDITDTGVGVTGAAAVLLAAALPVSVITLRGRKKKA